MFHKHTLIFSIVLYFIQNTRRQQHTHTLRQDLIPKILRYLQSRNTPVKSIVLAKHLGLSTSKPINPTLYALQRKNVIQCVSDQPTAWVIGPNHQGADNPLMEQGEDNSSMDGWEGMKDGKDVKILQHFFKQTYLQIYNSDSCT